MNLTHLTAVLVCAAVRQLAACSFDDDLGTPHDTPSDPRDALQIDWARDAGDPTIDVIVLTPAHLPRFASEARFCTHSLLFDQNVDVVDVQRLGRSLDAFTDLDTCVHVDDAEQLRPDDVVQVTLADAQGKRVTVERALPPFPTDVPVAHQAISALRTPDGTTWSATPKSGLVGVATDGSVTRYSGVASADPWDASAQEPQSPLVLALEPDPQTPGAMWLASAATGVSWFAPAGATGPTDVWVHGQPLDPELPAAAELAQTALAIAPDATRPGTAWVATLNGVFHVRRTAHELTFTRVADGPALAIAVDTQGIVWAGFSTQAELTASPPARGDTTPTPVALPRPDGALLRLDPGADAADPSDDTGTWAMVDEDAVTAILPSNGGAWIGTPYRLERATFVGATLTVAPVSVALPDLAVVALARTSDGFWLAARAECRLGGSLLHVTLDGTDIVAIADHSEAGFGEHDFNALRVLDDGALLVSTLVPALSDVIGPLGTARGCKAPEESARSADLYVLPSDGGPALRFGSR